mmetsp:Transcript_17534/g.50189  ORF Transcript_17534/g.50189 Transcript_17534/m.50189 type:complete len:300 (-) Transcript_17534:380-1279(-)
MLTSPPSSRVVMNTGTTQTRTIWAEVTSIWTTTMSCLPMPRMPRSKPRHRPSQPRPPLHPAGSARHMVPRPRQAAMICPSPSLLASLVEPRIALVACRRLPNLPLRPAPRRPSHRLAPVASRESSLKPPPRPRPRPVSFPRNPSRRSAARSRRRRRRRRSPQRGRRGRSRPLPSRSRSAAPVPPPRARKSLFRRARGPPVGPNPRLMPSSRRPPKRPPSPSLTTSSTLTTVKTTALMMPSRLSPTRARVRSALPVAVARSRSLQASPRATARTPCQPRSPMVWPSRLSRTRPVAGPKRR